MVKLKNLIPKNFLIASIIVMIIGAVVFCLYVSYIISITDPLQVYTVHLSIISAVASLLLALIAFAGLLLTSRAIKLTSDSIKANTLSSRHQSTIQLVMDVNKDVRLQDTKNLIFMKAERGELTDYYLALCKETDCLSNPDQQDTIQKNEKLKDDIHYVLNRYEFIALGIRRGAFDGELYKELNCSNFNKLWKFTKPLIMEIRNRQKIETIYQEIEWLYKSWQKNPINQLG
tara:strand:- start:655 stop:1347 length:693 start_codon:yes stop_codon:yes gene_type:complete